MNGILNLDKPPGITSHDCVARIRRVARIKRVGHAGTLDPLATGVLLLCIGQATRLSEYLMGGRKVYRAGITFGASTDTQDSTGSIVKTRDASGLTEDVILSLLPRFTGAILQVPPMVSALHHQGQRLYDLARQGIEVEREARPVTIYEYRLLGFTPGEQPSAEVEVACSAGTYIRTLANDLGEAAGTGAHMSALRRTQVGAFRVEEAMPLEEAEERIRTGELTLILQPMSAALAGAPMASVGPEEWEHLRHGRAIDAPAIPENTELVGVIGPSGELVALGRTEAGQLRPFKVFPVE